MALEIGQQVSAADLVRNFASVRQRASEAPVYVTSHGKVSHVLCTASKFRSLSTQIPGAEDGQVGLDVIQLATWIDDAIILIDRQGELRHTNSAMLALVRSNPTGKIGTPIFAALPELRESIAHRYIQRAIEFGEQAQFEMPSPFASDSWLHCRIAPVGSNIAIFLRNITREVQSLRMQNLQEEVMRAMEFNEDIAFVRLSVRGFIERVNQNFVRLVGISEERLVGHHFSNLVDLRMRAMVNEELERVLGRNEGRNIFTRLLTNQGEVVEVQMGAACTHDGYGCDGAAIVICRADSEAAMRQTPPLLHDVSLRDRNPAAGICAAEIDETGIKLRGTG